MTTSTPVYTTSAPSTLENHNVTEEFTTAVPERVNLGLVLGVVGEWEI